MALHIKHIGKTSESSSIHIAETMTVLMSILRTVLVEKRNQVKAGYIHFQISQLWNMPYLVGSDPGAGKKRISCHSGTWFSTELSSSLNFSSLYFLSNVKETILTLDIQT